MIKRFFICGATLALLTACAEDYYQSQYPAPVYGGQAEPPTLKYPTPQTPQTDAVETKPLKDYVPETKPLEQDTVTQSATTDVIKDRSDPIVHEPVQQQPIVEENVEELPPLEEKPAEAPAEPDSTTEYKPLESNRPISTPVDALVLAAKEDSASGNLEAAGASIERAIRIKPRNASLYYQLAVIRLDQSQPRLAEDLAKKAALLASEDNTIKKHSWLLIARARELQNNPEGAETARKKANSF